MNDFWSGVIVGAVLCLMLVIVILVYMVPCEGSFARKSAAAPSPKTHGSCQYEYVHEVVVDGVTVRNMTAEEKKLFDDLRKQMDDMHKHMDKTRDLLSRAGRRL